MSNTPNDHLIGDNDDEEAPGTEVLPLDAWHRERGGRMVEFAGYWMPVQYAGEGGGIIAEHLWTRSHAGLFDVSHMGQLEISGDGAEAALEAVLPIDLATLKPGRQRYSLLLDENGGVLDDLMLTNAGEHFYMVVNGATKWDDIAHLREDLPDAITLTLLDEAALLALQGPEAAQALGRLGLVATGEGAPSVGKMTFMDSATFRWGEVPLRVSRSGYTGEDGYEISVPAAHVAVFADTLCAQPEVRPIGLGARDSLRLEAGLPLYGHDLSPEIGAVEAGLTFAINKRRKTQGGFPGAERTLAELAGSTARKRVGLLLDGRQAAREGAAVFAGDRQIGVLTSGGFSPSLERPIAMAYVDAAQAVDGTVVSIEVRGKRLSATVAPLPFVPNRYHRKGAAT